MVGLTSDSSGGGGGETKIDPEVVRKIELQRFRKAETSLYYIYQLKAGLNLAFCVFKELLTMNESNYRNSFNHKDIKKKQEGVSMCH